MNHVLFAGGGTGGHLYPALALADALKEVRPDVQVHFVGAQRGVEARVLPAENRPHTLLPFDPLRRSEVWQNWRLIPSMWRSYTGLRRLFREFKPELVVGTGGYASGPACLFGISKGVPVAIQEQNSHAGLTQRTVGRWANQIHLGFPEARKDMRPGRNTEVFALGNPIRPPVAISKAEARAKFGVAQDSIVVLVTGGSQGARAINEAMIDAVQTQMPGVEIIWATGPTHIERVQAAVADKPWVHAHGYIGNMPEAMVAADIAISRSGASTTAEMLANGLPMILIPLPTAAADHQTHNARALEQAGAAVMLMEKDLSGARVNDVLGSLIGDVAKRQGMQAAAMKRAQPNAAHDIAMKLAELLHE